MSHKHNTITKSLLAISSILLALPSQAATVSLSGASNNCTYSSYTADVSGNLSVTCAGTVVPPVVTPPTPTPPPPPANCTIIPVTWNERLSLTFHPKFKMMNGQSYAFKKALNPITQTYASVDYASTGKYMSISRNPCEFTVELEAKYCGKGARGNDVTMPYGPNAAFGVCQVGTGDYYINVRNANTRDGADNCPVGQECEYYLSW